MAQRQATDQGPVPGGSSGSKDLSTFDSRADLEFGLAMPMPAVYRLTNDGVAWKADLRLMFPRAETMHRS
jgi:hypothetical protein